MKKYQKILIIAFILAFSVSFVDAKEKRKNEDCSAKPRYVKTESSSDNQNKRKELTPAEKECMKDVRDFIFSYRIIKGIHDRFEEGGYSVPSIVKSDLEEADEAYYALEKYLSKTSLYTHEVLNLGSIFLLPIFAPVLMKSPDWALGWCKEMYNQEMNEVFGTHFSSTSGDPFLESNFVCHTSYQDALKKVRAILHKYQSGQHKCK